MKAKAWIGGGAMVVALAVLGCESGGTTSDGANEASAAEATASAEAGGADASPQGLSAESRNESASDGPAEASAPPLLDFTMQRIDGEPINLADYRGRAVLFVNVASRCGFTKQYADLQALDEVYGDEGLAIVGVPANNFGGQEPGSNEQIAAFCSDRYGVTFDMLAKVSVKGEDQCELYRALIAASAGLPESGEVRWNFEKFLLNREGELVGRFRSKVNPMSPAMLAAVEAALRSSGGG